jgi:hypothetical protein
MPERIKINPTPDSIGLVCNVLISTQVPARMKMKGVAGYPRVLYGTSTSRIFRRSQARLGWTKWADVREFLRRGARLELGQTTAT